MPSLLLTLGDPLGVGPQITLKAWQALSNNADDIAFGLIAPEGFLESVSNNFGLDVPIQYIHDVTQIHEIFSDALPILPMDTHIDIADINAQNPHDPDQIADLSPITISSITRAVKAVRKNPQLAIVTNPISKIALYKTGFNFPGHTEFLADLCKTDADIPYPVMMLVGGGLRVALATIHQPLAEAISAINMPDLIRIGQITHNALQARFNIARPRLAFTGLNPHAGEGGALGDAEIRIINPAAQALREAGIDISDALSGDTVFHHALEGQFDGVIAMYHDQGLIPVKTLDFFGGVNVTLGLPIIRTSPDHGTAYDLARTGAARPDSLIAAIRLAAFQLKNTFNNSALDNEVT